MINNRVIGFLLATGLVCSAANASTIFNFDGDSLGTVTTFTNTVNGLSATFSSAADPGGFVVSPSFFSTLSGNVLGDQAPGGINPLALDVSFSHDLLGLTLSFVTADFTAPSPFTLTAYENSQLVGSSIAAGSFPAGFSFPEGVASFNGGTFNRLVISSTAPDFAIDNISATTSSAPEPSAYVLLGTGLFMLGISSLRRGVRR